jgi:hypothetical protein
VTVLRYVDTASSGGDGTTEATSGANAAYASLSSWEANAGGDATETYHVKCRASGGAADTTGVTIDFATNITSGAVIVEGNSDHADGRNNGTTFIDDTVYRLVVNGNCIAPQEANTTLRGLQLDCTTTGTFNSAINLTSARMPLTVEYCRVRSVARAVIGFNASNPTTVSALTLRNNILVGTGPGGVVDLDSAGTNNAALTWGIDHNTIYASGARPGIRLADLSGAAVQTVNIRNNIVANTSDPFILQTNVSLTAISTDYNWTDSGTDGTTNEQTLPSHASTFASAAATFTANFSLLTALQTSAQVSGITDDITLTARGTPPDAGAYEFVESGSTSVVTAISTEHAQSADNTTFFQSHVFVAIDATQAHTADTAAFVQTHILVAQDASHDHTAGETNFNATQALTVADATQGHTADEATLSQTHILVGADQTQAHTADETTFTVQGGLVVADASHDHTADTATLAQTHALVVADASHSVSSDNATLAQTQILAADSTTHGHTADATDFVSGVLLLVDDTAHGHSSDAATLAQTHILVCADAEHGQSADDATLAQIHALVVANATHGMDSDVVDLDSFIPGPATLNTLTLDARRPGVTFDVTTGRSVSV